MLIKYSTKLVALLMLLVSTMSIQAQNTDPLDALFNSGPQFLEVDDAFQFSYQQKGNTVELSWLIADDYYLYRDKFQFSIENATLGEIEQPEGTQIDDEFFGITNVYFFEANIDVAVADIQPGATLSVRYQGCAKAGLCYNPVVKKLELEIPANKDDMVSAINTPSANENASSQFKLADALENKSLILTLLIFFGLGAGLAFTPCVFPMFPILSGIIAGQKDLTTRKGLLLAFIYVQGMALTYSLLGLVVASMGSQFQGYLQHPSVLIAVSILFVFLAASMFGWINFQLPQSWTSRITETSNKQKSGNFTGVFLMGALSGLIASPCTTAPLTGALLYVAQTGDLVIGFVTLYVLSLGMGLPLLLIGASGGRLLPKAGNWMNVVKVVFGFILLSIPLILLERMVDAQYILIGVAVLSLLFSGYMHMQYLQTDTPSAKSGFGLVRIVTLVLGLVLLFKPLLPQPSADNEVNKAMLELVSKQLNDFGENAAHGSSQNLGQNDHHFKLVRTIAEIEQEVQKAAMDNKVVMLDLYADWCVACKEFEKYTFSDATVKEQMARMVLLQVDMTSNSDADIEIYDKFSVFGLPTIMFFDLSGKELTQNRVTGFLGADEFSQHLDQILN